MNIDLLICFFLLANRHMLTLASCTMQIYRIPFLVIVCEGVSPIILLLLLSLWDFEERDSSFRLHKVFIQKFCYSERYFECFGVLGYHLKPYYRRPVESSLSVHHHPVSLHEMHMKDVPYINHRSVKL